MKTITVVMPTIQGREESCELMLEHFRQRTPGYELEIIMEYGHPNWPAACNAGIPRASGTYIFPASDDLEPLPGWADAMVACLDRWEMPAPQIWNYKREGPPVNQGEDGLPGQLAPFTRSPALTREMADLIGPWPEIDYYSDNWVSDKARTLGIQIRVTEGYAFIHHWHPVGRLDHGDWQGRSQSLYLAEAAKL